MHTNLSISLFVEAIAALFDNRNVRNLYTTTFRGNVVEFHCDHRSELATVSAAWQELIKGIIDTGGNGSPVHMRSPLDAVLAIAGIVIHIHGDNTGERYVLISGIDSKGDVLKVTPTPRFVKQIMSD
jgi:hypothetical protein